MCGVVSDVMAFYLVAQQQCDESMAHAMALQAAIATSHQPAPIRCISAVATASSGVHRLVIAKHTQDTTQSNALATGLT
jgi:hypothetical protein